MQDSQGAAFSATSLAALSLHATVVLPDPTLLVLASKGPD